MSRRIEIQWAPFVLALSVHAPETNGRMIQLSVGMCPECGALVAEDQAQLHETFHARAGA